MIHYWKHDLPGINRKNKKYLWPCLFPAIALVYKASWCSLWLYELGLSSCLWQIDKVGCYSQNFTVCFDSLSVNILLYIFPPIGGSKRKWGQDLPMLIEMVLHAVSVPLMQEILMQCSLLSLLMVNLPFTINQIFDSGLEWLFAFLLLWFEVSKARTMI